MSFQSTVRRVADLAIMSVVAAAISSAALAAGTISKVTPGDQPRLFHSATDDLKAHGYVEEEFFISGTTDGKANAEAAVAPGAYKTRLIVRRPMDAKTFNGTVVVEWQNVTLGFDLEVGWPMFAEHMMREGYAWVGVSVQPVGLHHLKSWDAKRYGSIAHPALPAVLPPPMANTGFVIISDETYSDGIYTDIAAVLHNPGAVDPLAGLKPARLLSYGISQSAGRLTRYINALPANAKPYDGYYLHAGIGKLRDDLNVPVFGLNSEAEVSRYAAIRQKDSPRFRYWEVAGSGHMPRLGDDVLSAQTTRDDPAKGWPRTCDFGPGLVSIEYTSRAALHHLNEWVKSGKAPPHAPLMEITAASPSAIVFDQHQNAKGGLRLPFVDVPTGRNIGVGTPDACRLIPGYVPFDAATMKTLYPTDAAYAGKVDAAIENAVKAGYVLPADAAGLRAYAMATKAGKTTTAQTDHKH